MCSAPAALERHRSAVRARLLGSGAVRPGPGSVSWKVNREIVVVAGWGRAILLQLAHPLIAAGVADHSSFRVSLMTGLKRLSSTVGAMLSLTFGTDEEAISAAAGINGIHDRVSGRLDERVGEFDAGGRYSAHDPELLRWVHATLLDSTFLVYELVVGPLTAEERDRYCGEATRRSWSRCSTSRRGCFPGIRRRSTPTSRKCSTAPASSSAHGAVRLRGRFSSLPAGDASGRPSAPCS
jgi:uncharacterized protein (DUF2236 family)